MELYNKTSISFDISPADLLNSLNIKNNNHYENREENGLKRKLDDLDDNHGPDNDNDDDNNNNNNNNSGNNRENACATNKRIHMENIENEIEKQILEALPVTQSAAVPAAPAQSQVPTNNSASRQTDNIPLILHNFKNTSTLHSQPPAISGTRPLPTPPTIPMQPQNDAGTTTTTTIDDNFNLGLERGDTGISEIISNSESASSYSFSKLNDREFEKIYEILVINNFLKLYPEMITVLKISLSELNDYDDNTRKQKFDQCRLYVLIQIESSTINSFTNLIGLILRVVIHFLFPSGISKSANNTLTRLLDNTEKKASAIFYFHAVSNLKRRNYEAPNIFYGYLTELLKVISTLITEYMITTAIDR